MGQQLASVKEQVSDVSRERDEQASCRQQAEQESQQLRKSLQDEQDEVKRLNGEATKAAKEVERMAQDIQNYYQECTKAGDQKAGMLYY